MAHLVVLKGLNAKQSIELDKDRILVGRNANCDIVLPANDFAVSREHACILRVQGRFFIEAMGHSQDPAMVDAIEQARKHCLQLTVLGSYPLATDVL